MFIIMWQNRERGQVPFFRTSVLSWFFLPKVLSYKTLCWKAQSKRQSFGGIVSKNYPTFLPEIFYLSDDDFFLTPYNRCMDGGKIWKLISRKCYSYHAAPIARVFFWAKKSLDKQKVIQKYFTRGSQENVSYSLVFFPRVLDSIPASCKELIDWACSECFSFE